VHRSVSLAGSFRRTWCARRSGLIALALSSSIAGLACTRGLDDLKRDPTGAASQVRHWPRVSPRPDTQLEDITFRARSNETVHGTLAAPVGAKAAPALLYLHRASETRAAAVELAADLVPQGLVVLAIDMPGFGTRAIEGAPSDPSTLTWFLKLACEEARDAVALLRKLPEVDPDRITVMGASLGSRVAAFVASRHQVHAAVLLVPSLSRIDLAQEEDQMALRALGAIECPVLLISATSDEVVPKETTATLLQALHAPTTHKTTPGGHRFPFAQVAPDVIPFLREVNAAGSGEDASH
jgi:dienelactone hydrolase